MSCFWVKTFCRHNGSTKGNMTITMAKEERINVRASTRQKQLLAQAAAATGVSISEFMLERALRDAQDAILDQRIFYFTPDEYDAFVAQGEDVAENQAKIQKIMERKAPWES